MAVILSLGSINADFELRIDDLSDFGTSLKPVDGLVRLSGGKGANVAVLARRLGCEARLIGRVGEDDLARQALAGPRVHGVDVRGVMRASGRKTGFALIAVDPAGRRRAIAAAGANFDFQERDIAAVERAIESASPPAALACDYEVAPDAVSRAIACARRCGLPVVVDPSFPHLVQREDLGSISALTPDEREARALAGADGQVPLAQVARTLAALGPEAVCIKLDGGGCLLATGGELWRQSAAPSQVVDRSGAGDAFTGALAVGLAQGWDMRRAVLLGVVATEAAVAAFGAQPSYPSQGRLRALMHDGRPRPLEPWREEHAHPRPV